MAGLTGSWEQALRPEFGKPYYRELYNKVSEAYRTQTVYPPASEIFTAFHLTPLDQVKAVILGQDPYHEPGQAEGLAFSVPEGIEIPPSLVNIFQELHDDVGCPIPKSGEVFRNLSGTAGAEFHTRLKEIFGTGFFRPAKRSE